MTQKRFTWLKKDCYAPQIVITDSLTKKDLTPTDCYGLLNGLHEENKELKKQLEREETDKKRLMSYLMRYKGFNFDESRTYTLGELVCDLLNKQWEQYLKIKTAYENVYEYMEKLENHYYNNKSQKELINQLMDEKLELKKSVIFLQGELHEASIKNRQMALREVRDEIDKLIEMGDYH